MYVVDANLLLNAVCEPAPEHPAAQQWLDDALGSGATVGFPWSTLTGFLRLATSKLVLPFPLTAAQAADSVRAWLAVPNGVPIEPTPRHVDVLAGLLEETGTSGNRVNDAHLAALAIEYGGAVVSFDTDFALFGVEWIRPRKA